ncbi:MAG: NAD-binding protein, partial [Sphingomonadales bacterium]|nr:NAD-binding protein [Sphingomonadales bacterium]
MTEEFEPHIVIVGLGYVGLPLAVALARHYRVTGFDNDPERIAELRRGEDRTGEIAREELEASSVALTVEAEQGRDADIYIVTVPTPVDAENDPDLSLLIAASRSVAGLIEADKKPVIVFESTVYPGVTEEIC